MDEELQALVNAVAEIIEDAGAPPEDAQRALGQMLIEAGSPGAGATGGGAWRERLRDLGVAEHMLDAASRRLAVPRASATTRPAEDEVHTVLGYAQVLGDPSTWDPAVEYASCALAIIDAVWSIGVRYQGVQNVVERYRRLRLGQGADAERDTPLDLVRLIDAVGGPEAFADAVRNRQRTSSRSGILKAEAVYREAQILVDDGIETPGDLRGAPSERLERVGGRWRSVTGQGSGISLDYFLMLNGLPGVKADRWIRRFVAKALELPNELAVSVERAGVVTRAVAERLGVDERVLDYRIWRHESGQ